MLEKNSINKKIANARKKCLVKDMNITIKNSLSANPILYISHKNLVDDKSTSIFCKTNSTR